VPWSLQQRLFRVISRSCIAAYGRFPVFGALRGSAAVIRRGHRFLVVERSDGLGLAFPGAWRCSGNPMSVPSPASCSKKLAFV